MPFHDEPRSAVFFAGDLSDPWVAELAERLPAATPRLDCPGALPAEWPDEARQAATWVLHRAVLEATDAERLRAARRLGLCERLILCVGPQARYHQLQRWSGLATAVLGEATAAEILPRYLGSENARVAPNGAARGEVAIVSSNRGLRDVLEASCRAAGYAAQAVPGWSGVPTAAVTLWDAPVLEPDWLDRLARESARRPVIAVVGFPDRPMVAAARRAGASACLELPCDPADLAYLLHRMTARTPPHPLARSASVA